MPVLLLSHDRVIIHHYKINTYHFYAYEYGRGNIYNAECLVSLFLNCTMINKK